MQMRLLACNDKLFAYDAKYHKNCLNAYTSEWNILAAKSKIAPQISEETVTDKAFLQLSEEIRSDLLVDTETVVTLKNLHERFSK